MTFQVFRADGTEVRHGDELIDFRGEGGTRYLGCTHPRKINVDVIGVTRFPSVYNVEIRGPEGYVWNPVSEVGKLLAQVARGRV